MHVDTDELRAFDAVAARCSFSLAAAELGCSQSTVSQRIARLERRLGRTLIRRTTRQVRLTPDGEAMLTYARSILAIADEAQARFDQPALSGVLKVGIEEEFAATRLSQILIRFCTRFLSFGLKLVTGRDEFLRDALRSGGVDVILAKSHLDRGAPTLWREQLAWIGHPSLGNLSARPVPLISYMRPSATRNVAEAALRANRRPWVNVAECGNLLGLLAAANAGLGVIAIGRSISAPGLVEMPKEAGLPDLGAFDYVLEGGSSDADPAVAAFRSVLSEAAKQVALGSGSVRP